MTKRLEDKNIETKKMYVFKVLKPLENNNQELNKNKIIKIVKILTVKIIVKLHAEIRNEK